MSNGNGQPRKSRPKRSKRLRAIEASLDALSAIADEGRDREQEDEDERFTRAIAYMDEAGLPMGEDVAEFFLPDEHEILFLIASSVGGFDAFATTIAAMKASSFMHGYLHAQIEDGVRDKAGKIL
jgi:hypothetical protein